MATYSSSNYSTTIPTRHRNGLCSQVGSFSVTVALATSDVLNLIRLPAGAKVLDVWVSSGGTQGANSDSTFSVSDGTNTFITSAGGLALRSGGGVSKMNGNTVGLGPTSEAALVLTIVAQGTGQTTGGSIRYGVLYQMEQ